MAKEGSVIVTISFSEKSDILLVGKKEPGMPVDIVNAFEGEEARELWEKLTVKAVNTSPTPIYISQNDKEKTL